MRILHVSDFHFHKRWFRWVTDHAENHDLIIYAGDFLDIFGDESLGSQVRWIGAWARSLPRPLLFCSGNHDVDSPLKPVSSGAWLMALPGVEAFSRSRHHDRFGQTFVQMNWPDVMPPFRGGDIVLAHAPPAGCFTAMTAEIDVDHGDQNLADALRSSSAAPWLVLSGHVHDPARWIDRCGRTISLNPGVTLGASVPNHITIDTSAGKAAWFVEDSLEDVINLPRSCR